MTPLKPDSIHSTLSPLFAYLKKRREDQKFNRTLEVSFTLLLITFFIFFAIKPTFLTISTLVGDIRAKEALVVQLKAKIDDIVLAQDLFAQAQERYHLVDSSLPIRPNLFNANGQIVAIAFQNQIPLNKIEYRFPDDENNSYQVNLNTSANFNALFSMMDRLSKNRRLIDLDGLTFSLNPNKEASSSALNLNLPLKIYYWPENDQK